MIRMHFLTVDESNFLVDHIIILYFYFEELSEPQSSTGCAETTINVVVLGLKSSLALS